MNMKGVIVGIMMAAFVWGVVSCSNPPTEPTPPVQVGMQVDFKPSALATLIDSAILRIVYPEEPEPLIEYPTVSYGMIRDTLILLPGDSVEFNLAALSAEGLVLYRGSDVVNIAAGERVTVELYMEPVVSILRPAPLYQEISLSGAGEAAVGIELYNVDVTNLFGAAFRVLYDTTRLSVVDVQPGPFLAEDIIPVMVDSLDHVAFGMTRTTGEGGAEFTGSPRLATIYFAGLAEGTVTLHFDVERAEFTEQSGQFISEMSQMVFETAEIVVVP